MRMTESGKHMLKKGAAKYLALSFALIFLVFQSSTLVHSHAGDLNKHLDCTFCLTLGSGDDVLPGAMLQPPEAPAPLHVLTVSPAAFMAEVSAPRSRSPPLFPLI